jgi:hypothetical protein
MLQDVIGSKKARAYKQHRNFGVRDSLFDRGMPLITRPDLGIGPATVFVQHTQTAFDPSLPV